MTEQYFDKFFKRLLFFSFGVFLLWWAQFRLRLITQSGTNSLRSMLGADLSEFSSHLFSHGLPVFLTSVGLYFFYKKFEIIKERVSLEFNRTVLKEGIVWSILAALPVIPFALSMGYKLGFNFQLQEYLGNIISNSYEEFVYRFLFFWLSSYFLKGNKWLAIILVNIVFGLVHDQCPLMIQGTVAIAGICFSLAYTRTGSLLTAILAHQIADMILDTILIQ